MCNLIDVFDKLWFVDTFLFYVFTLNSFLNHVMTKKNNLWCWNHKEACKHADSRAVTSHPLEFCTKLLKRELLKEPLPLKLL